MSIAVAGWRNKARRVRITACTNASAATRVPVLYKRNTMQPVMEPLMNDGPKLRVHVRAALVIAH